MVLCRNEKITERKKSAVFIGTALFFYNNSLFETKNSKHTALLPCYFTK